MSRGNSHRFPKDEGKGSKAVGKVASGNNMEPRVSKVRKVMPDKFYSMIEEVAVDGAVMLAPLDKFKSSIVGIDTNGRIVYSRDRIVSAFMNDGMSLDDADEFCSYNTERAIQYVEEEKRPIILAFEIP